MSHPTPSSGLELWGGHECTVNRTRSGYKDQTRLSGHEERITDLDRFAEVGCKAVRYPILWERTAPDRPDDRDWSWSDERMIRLKQLGVRPIVGLVHHGSGPAYTSLLDDSFAPGLAAHAAAVAARYPWVEDWTPVNEPLTTARFSALYGFWYPHVADEGLFWTALLNQIDATRLSMRAIREVVPGARLIQTEDLGRVRGTSEVAEQVDFENARRWMTWDLLCGRVTPDHELWPRVARHGLADRLRAIADDPCPPDVVGVNHYLTSDRFLDHRLDRYPPERHGGNGEIAYADVEAVRVLTPTPEGFEGVLREACERYGLPTAATEVHNGCTREEQMRWLLETWRGAERLRAEGLPIVAVTSWALLGSHDWCSLLTRDEGRYEAGAFDLRGGAVRPTGVARLMRELSRGEAPHPAALGAGWWRRDIRLEYAPVKLPVAPKTSWTSASAGCEARPILIAGATGTLGQTLARACAWRGLDYVLTDRARLNLADPESIARTLREVRPWAVVNAAGWVRVDDAENDPDGCLRANADGAVRLAMACAEHGVPLATFSSDLVFDGEAGRPYREDDPTRPLNVYGQSKATAEERILALGSEALIVRTAAFFSAHDPYNFAAALVGAQRAGHEFVAADDVKISPTHTPELADATLDLLIDGEQGIWHLANDGEVSWAEFARLLSKRLGADASLIRAVSSTEMGWTARRPVRSSLVSTRGAHMKALDEAIDRYGRELAALV